MKKFLINSAAIFFLAVITYFNGQAQTDIKRNYSNYDLVAFYDTPTANPHHAGADISDINTRAIKDFKKSFKSVSGETWFKLDNGGSLVKFNLNGINSRSDYDKKGNWICTTRYYSEKELPKDVRTQVKSDYFDFSITQVEELTFPEHLVYIVHMQDETKWMNIRICDGEMDVMQEFAKK